MSSEWIPEWRQDLARRLSEAWTPDQRERAWQAIAQPLPTGEEASLAQPVREGLNAPPLSPHGPALVELASIGHDFAFELESAHSDKPEVQERLETLRNDHRAWLEQRRQALQQLAQVARELEILQKRVGAEAAIAREPVKLRLERWL